MSSQIEATAYLAKKNIRTIAELEREFSYQRSREDAIGDIAGSFAGSVNFVLINLAWFAGWILLNSGMWSAYRGFDPYPFPLLQLLIGLEAILLFTFVLMRQNYLSRQSDHRSHLILQISLLAESESTKMLQILQQLALREKGHEHQVDEQVRVLAQDTHIKTLSQELRNQLPLE